MDKAEVLKLLEGYSYNQFRAKEIKSHIESICPKLTTTYGNLAPAQTNAFRSQVESKGIVLLELKAELEVYEKKLRVLPVEKEIRG